MTVRVKGRNNGFYLGYKPTAEDYIPVDERAENPQGYGRKHKVDPWLAVCDRCPLDDCVRTEGDYRCSDKRKDFELYFGCPVFVAQEQHGWTATEALDCWQELGLLEAEW